MSFDIKSLKKNKTKNIDAVTSHYYPVALLGDDLSIVLKLMNYKNELGPDKVRLFSSRLLTKKMLEESLQNKPSTYSAEDQLKKLVLDYPNLKFYQSTKPSVFFKDGKWHDFAGRAKPMNLLKGERVFIEPRADIEVKSFFTESDWENLDLILSTYSEVKYIEKIQSETPSDLAEPDHWHLTFRDHSTVKTSHLVVSCEKNKLLKATNNGTTLPAELAEIIVGSAPLNGVSVTFEAKKSLFEDVQTYFIPQSFTHEWGHYIVEQKPFNNETQTALTNVTFIIHEEEPNPEDVASKIKHMKRVIDRIIPNFEKEVSNETIICHDEMWITHPAFMPQLDNIELLPSFNAITP